MMAGVLLAAASLALGMPTSCVAADREAAAFYQGGLFAVSVLEPYCREVRDGTEWGAWILAHELGHAYQDALGLPFDEGQADRLADSWWRSVWRLLGGRSSVRLGP